MENLLIAGVVLGLILMLCLLAAVIRVILVFVAKKNGYTADNMPIIYHIVGFGIYFSVLIICHAAYLTAVST